MGNASQSDHSRQNCQNDQRDLIVAYKGFLHPTLEGAKLYGEPRLIPAPATGPALSLRCQFESNRVTLLDTGVNAGHGQSPHNPQAARIHAALPTVGDHASRVPLAFLGSAALARTPCRVWSEHRRVGAVCLYRNETAEGTQTHLPKPALPIPYPMRVGR
jgi:hypothetical protein